MSNSKRNLEPAVSALEKSSRTTSPVVLLRELSPLLSSCQESNRSELVARVLLLRSTTLRRLGKTKEALKAARQARRVAYKNQLVREGLDADRRIAFLYLQLFDYDKAVRLAWQALDQARQEKLSWIEADVLALIGHLHEVKDQFNKALVYFREAIACAESAGHTERIITALSDMGRINSIQGNYTSALDYFQRARDLAAKSNSQVYMPTILLRIGDVFRAVGDYDRALRYHRQSLTVAEDLGVFTEVVEARGQLARLLLDRGEFASALKVLEENEALSLQLGYQRHARFGRAGIAVACNGLGRHAEATQILWPMVETAVLEPASNHVLLQQMLEQLAIAYRNLSRPQAADQLGSFAARLKEASRSGVYTTHSENLVRQDLYAELPHLVKQIRSEELGAIAIRGRIIDLFEGKVKLNDNDLPGVLTPTERLIFRCLVKHQGEAVPEAMLAETYSEGATHLDREPRRRLTHVHIMNIRRKLNDHDKSLIITVSGVGWRLADR